MIRPEILRDVFRFVVKKDGRSHLIDIDRAIYDRLGPQKVEEELRLECERLGVPFPGVTWELGIPA
jgi:hypothetical protein